jgi:BioD-like phosphotransacetylase family protein
LIPFLAQKGIPPTVLVPEDPLLSSRSLMEVVEITRGEILLGDERLTTPVGGMTVGAGDLGGALGLFKRVYNKIVLLEPVSADEEGIESPRTIAGIVLTAGRRPAPMVMEAAQKANVPLVLVAGDTFATLDLLERTTPPLSSRDEVKVVRITELMDRVDGLDRLLGALNLDME